MPQNKNKFKKEIICLCNGITREKIENAISTMDIQNADELYDATGAGVGSCGGSCRSKTTPIIEFFKKHKRLPNPGEV